MWQDNSCDCGLFLLTYMDFFTHSLPVEISKTNLEQQHGAATQHFCVGACVSTSPVALSPPQNEVLLQCCFCRSSAASRTSEKFARPHLLTPCRNSAWSLVRLFQASSQQCLWHADLIYPVLQ